MNKSSTEFIVGTFDVNLCVIQCYPMHLSRLSDFYLCPQGS